MKINILGITGEGKTTVGLLIKKTLTEYGFRNVSFSDTDIIDSEEELNYFDQKLTAIKNNPIGIKSIQVQRKALFLNPTAMKEKEIIKKATKRIENLQIGKSYIKHGTRETQELGKLKWIIWKNKYECFGNRQEILLVFEKNNIYAADCGVIPYGSGWHNPFNSLVLQEG